MKSIYKLLFSSILIILLLIVCLIATIGGYTALFLHTYQVFTFREPVAEVTISEEKEDELGKYAEVRVKVIKKTTTALTEGVFGTKSINTIEAPAETFKIYGDTIYIGGPIVKFKDELIFVNFKTMYKLGAIYGLYRFDQDLERDRPKEAYSFFDLNGGYKDWKEAFDRYQQPGIIGNLYRNVIDTTQLSEPGQVVNKEREIKYVLYITNNSFLWDIKE